MKILRLILSWLVTIILPVALLFVGLRLLLIPAFLQVEYRMPGFPADTYGFTLEDRLHYAPLAVQYLVNDAGIEFLDDQTFPDGSPLYNGRELQHMEDVKNVVQPILWIGSAVWVFLIGIGLWAWFGKWWPEFRLALRRGGRFTVGLVAAVGLFAGFGFDQFFVAFHSIFFESDSWLFLYSDTLIRLFPIRFWQDCAIYIFVVAGGLGLLLALAKRKPKAN